MQPDTVYFPVNVKNRHWFLAVARRRQFDISTYDSIRSDHEITRAHIQRYMHDEDADKDICIGPWTRGVDQESPQQIGGDDCGVFVCMNAAHLVTGRSVSEFTSEHAETARKHICHKLMQYATPRGHTSLFDPVYIPSNRLIDLTTAERERDIPFVDQSDPPKTEIKRRRKTHMSPVKTSPTKIVIL